MEDSNMSYLDARFLATIRGPSVGQVLRPFWLRLKSPGHLVGRMTTETKKIASSIKLTAADPIFENWADFDRSAVASVACNFDSSVLLYNRTIGHDAMKLTAAHGKFRVRRSRSWR